GTVVDMLGEGLRRGAAITDVVFHPKVGLEAPGVVTGAQHQPTKGAVAPNHRRHRRGREQTTLPYQHAPKTVSCGEAHQALDGGAVVVTPIASYDQGLVCEVDSWLLTHRIKDRLHKVL